MLAGLVAEAVGVSPRRVNYIAFSGGGESLAAIVGGQVSVGRQRPRGARGADPGGHASARWRSRAPPVCPGSTCRRCASRACRWSSRTGARWSRRRACRRRSVQRLEAAGRGGGPVAGAGPACWRGTAGSTAISSGERLRAVRRPRRRQRVRGVLAQFGFGQAPTPVLAPTPASVSVGRPRWRCWCPPAARG